MGAIYTYNAYGLTIQAPFLCSGLSAGNPDQVPDLVVVEAELPQHLTAPEATGPGFEAEPNRILLRLGRHAGRFLVEDGCRVTLERSPTADEAALGFHFTHSVIAAAMRQRGNLVLHAAVAVRDSCAILLSGESGAGKSTTLAALAARDWAVISDDVTILQQTPSGGIRALPGLAQISLFEHTALKLDLAITGLPLYPWRRMKATIPVLPPATSAPVPLNAVFTLELSDGAVVESETVMGTNRFTQLQHCLYGPIIPSEYRGLLPRLAALANQIPLIRIRRPSHLWSGDDVVETILEHAVPLTNCLGDGEVGHVSEG